jgi:hypothetical protein
MLLMALILIFLISIASTWWFGLWSNLITLVNLILAGLIATSFFENLAFELIVRAKSYALLLPYVALWLLFAISFFVLRGVTDGLSGMRLKFDRITEMVGRSLLSLAIAGVLVCFVSFTLQLAPLRPSLFSEEKASFGAPLGPDKLWHGFVQQCSNGSLSYTSEETQFFPAYKTTLEVDGVKQTLEVRSFDPADSYFAAGASLRQTISGMQVLRIPSEVAQ